jgi:prepilin-type N-terminal cleavage/methylation domain-containing protein
MKKNKDKGFTLLELLIVIAIIAILSVALVIVLNPAETLKKARDAQRISDLSTMKTAIGLYLTNTAAPLIGGTVVSTAYVASNLGCKATPTAAWATDGAAASSPRIYYSLTGAADNAPTITDTIRDGGSAATPALAAQATLPALTSGQGWIPINFNGLTGGSPISNIPVDPVNTITSLSGVASTDLVYRYACSITPLAFEIDAQLESIAYTTDDNKRLSDGGNSDYYYETGTNLLILGKTTSGTDF